MSINERVKKIRKELGLSGEKFGERLGVTKTAISLIESGKNKVTDQTIKLICKEYNVSIAWLKEGKGDMFTDLPETLLDQLIDEYHLNDFDKNFIKAYIDMPDEQRNVINEFIKSLYKENKKDE